MEIAHDDNTSQTNSSIAVEGKFGQGKRRFSLARIMTKLAGTSEVSIMVSLYRDESGKDPDGGPFLLALLWSGVCWFGGDSAA